MPNENARTEHSIGVREAQPWASHAPSQFREPKARQYLGIDELENIWAAFGHSVKLGLLPNETLDIHFDRGELLDPYRWAGPCLRAFRKSARQWIERKGYQTAIIWVLENRGDGGGHGIHAHVLIHVPPALATRFHQLKARWARKAGLDMSVANVIKRKPVPTLAAAKGKLRYMSKDLDPRHWPMFQDSGGRVHLDDREKPSDQPIYGKKCGVSRNIDAKARRSSQPAHMPATVAGLSSGEGRQGPTKIQADNETEGLAA